jgi:hypothetical protein
MPHSTLDSSQAAVFSALPPSCVSMVIDKTSLVLPGASLARPN